MDFLENLHELGYQQIVDTLEELDINSQKLGWEDFDHKLVEEKLGPFTSVFDDRTGSDFDEHVIVYHFEKHDVYVQISGYYSSHNGTEWDEGFTEVRPQEKVIVEYIPV